MTKSNHKTKRHGRERIAESPVRHRTLAPFGGITRIRFKGSSDLRTSQPLRLPRTLITTEDKTRCV